MPWALSSPQWSSDSKHGQPMSRDRVSVIGRSLWGVLPSLGETPTDEHTWLILKHWVFIMFSLALTSTTRINGTMAGSC